MPEICLLEYLYGRWQLTTRTAILQILNTLNFENHTFEIVRTGKAETVGFWGIKADTLELHMVTSPAFFDDLHEQLAGFEGEYDYFRGKMVIFNTNNSGFEAVGGVGNEMRRATAVKCK